MVDDSHLDARDREADRAGLRSRSRRLNDASGEISDKP
jgi:hypothetical protein